VSEDGTAADPVALVKAISFLEVDVTDGDGSPIAKGLVTYRVFSSA
jgi:acyl-coenzyme A thioesterase PaaI-like protein